jgi:hypothetical protein
MWLCFDVNLCHGSGVYTRCVCTTIYVADKEANKIIGNREPGAGGVVVSLTLCPPVKAYAIAVSQKICKLESIVYH